MEGSMINYKSIEKLSQQFWVLAFVLLLPTTAFSAVVVNFNTMLSALKNNCGPIIIFVGATAYVMGIWFIVSAVMGLKRLGESAAMASQTHGSMSGPLMKLIIGVVLVYLPSTIDVSVTTLWGYGILGSDSSSVVSYSAASSDPFGPIKEGAIAVVRVIGYVSFVRGLVMLSHSGDQGSQQGSFGKGFMHIIGGVLAINIVGTIKIIGNTLGFAIM